MITKSNLQRAADENIISPDQIDPLYNFLQQSPTDSVAENNIDNREEPLKFIRSFGDIFITLGVLILVISINLSDISGLFYLIPAAGFVLVAEWLVRIRRLALPGMAILLSILYFTNKAITFNNENATILGFAVLAVTSFLFYLRYKMPFSLLPLAASLVAMVTIMIGIDVFTNPIIFAACGLVVFAVAFWFDSRDTKRESILSDGAFWLHLLASPLIVHGLMVTMLVSDQAWIKALNKELLMLIFFAGFFLLALLLDRRAMLISTQLYIIYAITQIFKDNITSAEDIIIYVLIAIGLFIIYFGAYWYKTRRLIFGTLSGSAISRYIPDLNISDIKR